MGGNVFGFFCLIGCLGLEVSLEDLVGCVDLILYV